MGRGFAWFDTGTHASLLDADNFVCTLSLRQRQQVGSTDEIAYDQGWIDARDLHKRAELFAKSHYGTYLRGLLADEGK